MDARRTCIVRKQTKIIEEEKKQGEKRENKLSSLDIKNDRDMTKVGIWEREREGIESRRRWRN